MDGCAPFAENMFEEKANSAIFHNDVAFELPIVLLERGNCSFVTKVRNVERAGANIALIADNKTESSEVFIMSDDGSGHSINIPSFMIRKSTAEAFKAAYASNERVIIKVDIDLGDEENIAQVALWYSTLFDLTTE